MNELKLKVFSHYPETYFVTAHYVLCDTLEKLLWRECCRRLSRLDHTVQRLLASFLSHRSLRSRLSRLLDVVWYCLRTLVNPCLLTKTTVCLVVEARDMVAERGVPPFVKARPPSLLLDDVWVVSLVRLALTPSYLPELTLVTYLQSLHHDPFSTFDTPSLSGKSTSFRFKKMSIKLRVLSFFGICLQGRRISSLSD